MQLSTTEFAYTLFCYRFFAVVTLAVLASAFCPFMRAYNVCGLIVSPDHTTS